MAPSRTQQLANRQFGYLKVLRRAGRDRNYRATWLCQCLCTEQVVVRGDHLLDGRHKACNVNGHRWTDWIEQTGRKRHVPR